MLPWHFILTLFVNSTPKILGTRYSSVTYLLPGHSCTIVRRRMHAGRQRGWRPSGHFARMFSFRQRLPPHTPLSATRIFIAPKTTLACTKISLHSKGLLPRHCENGFNKQHARPAAWLILFMEHITGSFGWLLFISKSFHHCHIDELGAWRPYNIIEYDTP